MVRKLAPFAILLMLFSALPVQAEGPGEMMFPNAKSCYQRLYSAQHLASHPGQKTTWMRLEREPMVSDPYLGLWLRVTLRGSPGGAFDAMTYCQNEGGQIYCAMEGDAGGFSVKPAKDGAILLSVGRDGVGFENDTGFVTLEKNRGDDRSFLLTPGICP